MALNGHLQRAAYSAVQKALKAGSIKRPMACEVCRQDVGVCSDGRSKLQAHHEDYAKPLDVKWVCPNCHRKETPWAGRGLRNGAHTKPEKRHRGETHPMAKLTNADVAEIKQIAAVGGVTSYRLGKTFGVNGKVIADILRGKVWAHVPPSAAPSTRTLYQASKVRGFAAISPDRHRDLCRMAAEARRKSGRAYKWSSAAAKSASAKGAAARARNRAARLSGEATTL